MFGEDITEEIASHLNCVDLIQFSKVNTSIHNILRHIVREMENTFKPLLFSPHIRYRHHQKSTRRI